MPRRRVDCDRDGTWQEENRHEVLNGRDRIHETRESLLQVNGVLQVKPPRNTEGILGSRRAPEEKSLLRSHDAISSHQSASELLKERVPLLRSIKQVSRAADRAFALHNQ